MSDTQTVVDSTEAEPNQAPAEETSAQDDLDSLLNEYQEPEAPVTPETPAIAPDEMAEFRAYMAETRADKVNSGLQESASQIKQAAGEAAGNIPEWMFVGALREESTRNPNLEKIFNDRGQNPEAWNKVATALGKKISQDLAQTDKTSTESWDAVDSAVHSSKSSSPSPEVQEDLSGKSDMEFSEYKRNLLKKARL